MEELTESARQCLVSQGIVIGAVSILNSLGLALLGIMVISHADDLLRFTSLTHLAILEIVCGSSSFMAVAFVWWVVLAYRNRHIELRSAYLDENMSRGLLAVIPPTILSFSSLVVGAIFLLIKMDTSSTYDLKSAMSLYSTDMTRKVIVDRIQILLQCCGSQTLLDWFLVDWQDTDFEPGVHILNASFSDWDSVPFSCCSTEAPPPCIHHQLRIFGVSSLYTAGCSDKLDDAVFTYVTLSVVMFFIGTFSLGLLLYSSRKLQTSARSAIAKGDAEAPGSWWLLSPAASVHSCVCDETPLLETHKSNLKPNKQKKLSNVTCNPKQNKISPGLVVQRSSKPSKIICEDCEAMKCCSKNMDGDSSEDWTRRACDESRSTSTSTFLTSTRLNSSPESRRSVSATVVASVGASQRFEQTSRALYRT